ncbi:MAG: threonine--tRNA ligase [Candidatus Altarchaeum sp. CG03_land_8_20_14_0_80_32_618]|nr:MAG: threonine--tRNA ligase [Candidatus Altarchaeum sp. CG03_land_8_20_14_0_80_32_618]
MEVKKKAISDADEINAKNLEANECLVVWTTVEKDDEKNKDEILNKTIDNIKDVHSKVNAKSIVIYPYAHLSSDLASPKFAKTMLQAIYENLKEQNLDVIKAPFGYYKGFEIKCKGHPLSELSREIKVEEVGEKEKCVVDSVIKEGEKKITREGVIKEGEKKITREGVVKEIISEFFVLAPTGEEYEINMKNLKENLEKYEIFNKFPTLKKYMVAEELKNANASSVEPPSIKAMVHMELIDYEKASDSGNLRFYPKGNLIFDLLSDWAEEIALSRLGAMKIETPLIYDWSMPDIREQGQSFHERHYMVKIPDDENKEFVLRFAGDFGLFRIMKQVNMSYDQLPIRIYEFSKSFRYEKKGELSGLRRLRAFHMPDVHSFCRDIEQGWDEYENLYKNYADLANATGIEYAVVFRIVKEFYDKYKDRLINLLRYSDKPAFVEVLSSMKHYWAVKHEFQGIDSVDGNCQLSTVQLDVKDASLYGINFVSKDGKKKGCTICHSSVGSIERWMFEILENALKKEKPMLPLWLSPTQIRIVPVSKEFLNFSSEIAGEIEKSNIRADIDDRNETLSAKIRKAEREWVPYIVVIGERERESRKFSVRRREDNKNLNMEISELTEEIKSKTDNMPFRKSNLSKQLSKRPIFVGYT